MSLSCFTSHGFFSPLWKGHLTINTVIWQLNIKQWIRCLLINWIILCTRACYTGEYGCRFSCCDTSFLLAACASAVVSLFSEVFTEDISWLLCFLHSTVTIPRQPRGWTPAWQRRQSPLRSARMAVCILLCSAGFLKRTLIPLNTAHAFTQGHTYIVYSLHYMSHHFSPFLTMNQATNQDEIWMFDFSLKWHIT